MPTVTITVGGIEMPQAGKKRGRIKDTNGMLYQALPSYLGMVKMGSNYDLTYKDDEYNGTKFRVVESVTPSMGIPQTPPPRAQQSYEPDRPVNDERSTDIATLAIVKEWIGRIPVGDQGALVHALRAARRGWLQFKANPDNIETGRQPPVDDGYPDDR